MTDWMTIRVVLAGRRGQPLDRPPGRLLLVHSDHTFADLSEAIDVAFGRWDLSPVHEFAVEGRRIVSAAEAIRDEAVEDSEDVTLGEVGLRLGARFSYVFDVGEGWEHDCRLEAVAVDPVDEYGDVPDGPVPLYGWGTIPDQYGRTIEDDEDDAPGDWSDTHDAWVAVASALADVERPRDDAALAAAAEQLRAFANSDDWPYDVLSAAGGLDDDDWPDDDEALWLSLASGIVAPRGALPLEPDAEAALAALEPAEWAGAVIELVRAGAGQPVDPPTVLALIERCPEVRSDELSPEDESMLVAGLDLVVELWAALGVIGEDGYLTPLGGWGLPESLRVAWGER